MHTAPERSEVNDLSAVQSTQYFEISRFLGPMAALQVAKSNGRIFFHLPFKLENRNSDREVPMIIIILKQRTVASIIFPMTAPGTQESATLESLLYLLRLVEPLKAILNGSKSVWLFQSARSRSNLVEEAIKKCKNGSHSSRS